MAEANSRCCPVCESPVISTIGPILHPRPSLVAGVELNLGNGEFWLRACRRCGFQFKDPPIDQDRLIECYKRASFDNWEADPDPRRRQFDVLENVAEKHAAGRRILDVGCFNGAVVSYFSGAWKKFGVNPAEAARRVAETRGVQVLGASLDELDRGIDPFDVILAIDVLEHIVDPMPFFQR